MISSIRLIYCAGCFLVVLGLGITWTNLSHSASDTEQRQLLSDVVHAEASAIERRLARSLYAAYFLALELQEHNGEFENFDAYAAQVINLLGGISSLQLAPNAIIEKIYPLEGNEAALGINLLEHEYRGKEALLAIENRELTFAGPFDMAQGGTGMVGYYPVFLMRDGKEKFWGFTQALIRLDELLSDVNLQRLQSRGYSYQLHRIDPLNGEIDVFARSDMPLTENSYSQQIMLPNTEWILTISPASPGLLESRYPGYLLSLVMALLLSFLLFQGLKSNQKLREARNIALRANNAKDEFLAGVSHEVRTPLSGLIGVIQLLKRTPLDRNQARYVATASSSGSMLLTIISDILDYTRLGSGKFAIKTERFDLVSLIEDVAYILSLEASRGKLELVTDIDPEVPHMISGDSIRLRQVLNNLLNNSIKFSEAGVVRIYARVESGKLRIGIEDSSPPIDEEQKNTIMTAVAEDETYYRRSSDNIALGLSISRHLLEAMGSQLHIENNESQGNHIYFSLEIDAEATASRDWKSPQALQDLVIAIFSPIAARRVEIAKMLDGWQVRKHIEVDFDCETAPALPPGDPPGLVIIDQLESDEKVNQSIDNLRNNAAWRNTRVIQLVPHGANLDAGLADARVNKPVLRQQLYDALMDIVYRQAFDQEYRPAEKVETVESPGLLAGKRILLVEDNPINKMIALETLDETGVTIDVAVDGAEAVEQVQRQQYDLVLMDIQLPVMDGYEATRKIRELGGVYASIPVIAITAYAQEADAARSAAAGMNDHITKPFDADEFIDIIVRHIEDRA